MKRPVRAELDCSIDGNTKTHNAIVSLHFLKISYVIVLMFWGIYLLLLWFVQIKIINDVSCSRGKTKRNMLKVEMTEMKYIRSRRYDMKKRSEETEKKSRENVAAKRSRSEIC